MTSIKFRSDVDVDLVEVNADDLRVAKAAWVSTKGDRAEDLMDNTRVAGLINFLVRERHGSPFEHNSFTFRISCPIFVVREFHRHRIGWSYNEESGRYTKLNPVFYVPGRDRNLVQSGKPGAYTFGPGSDVQYASVKNGITKVSKDAWSEYEGMLSNGVAKEVARMVLPLNIYTTFYATCNARSLMSFLSLRTEVESATFVSRPMKEIQLVSAKMEKEFHKTMPLTYSAWNNNGRVAP